MISTNLWVSTAPAAPLARCYRCNGEIPAKSEAMQGLLVVPIGYPDIDKLGLVFDGTRNPTRTSWFHLACAVDVFPEDTARALAPTLLAPHSDERAQALALAARRTAALRTRAPHAIEPARDPLGRPRVTVKVLGSASVSNTLSWMQLEVLTHDYAFCSSKREYVFDAPRSVASVAEVRDPSCPTVAGVVAALIDKPTVKSQRDKFAALYAVGITAPVLWLIGEGDHRQRDARVIELRTLLGSVGFDADSAPVVLSARVDQAALEALVAALDETHAPHTSVSDEARLAGLVQSVEDALSDADPAAIALRCDGLARWLLHHPIGKLPGGRAPIQVSPELVTKTHDVASRCLASTNAREAALSILWQIRDRRSEPALESLLSALFAERSRKLATVFVKAHGLLRELAPDRATVALVDGFFHRSSSASRRRDLGSFLVGSNDANAAKLLRERAVGASRAVAGEALALVAIIERARAKTIAPAGRPSRGSR
jgi:hypothetical protein